MTSDTRTEAERRYDAMRTGSLYFPTATMDDAEEEIINWVLDAIKKRDAGGLVDAALEYVAEVKAHDPICITTETIGAVTAERWEGDGSVFLEFTMGGDTIPHRILLGVVLEGYNPDGTAELVVDGTELDGAWTLLKLKRLRDDLDALLADKRVLRAFDELPPA